MREAHYDYAWITEIKNESRKTLHNRIYNCPLRAPYYPSMKEAVDY